MSVSIKVGLKNKLSVKVGLSNLTIGSGSGGNVTITDLITNTVIATITAPGNYNVLQFSGINGGAANTTFTNSVVPA